MYLFLPLCFYYLCQKQSIQTLTYFYSIVGKEEEIYPEKTLSNTYTSADEPSVEENGIQLFPTVVRHEPKGKEERGVDNPE